MNRLPKSCLLKRLENLDDLGSKILYSGGKCRLKYNSHEVCILLLKVNQDKQTNRPVTKKGIKAMDLHSVS